MTREEVIMAVKQVITDIMRRDTADGVRHQRCGNVSVTRLEMFGGL
jgi:hypothetical protein